MGIIKIPICTRWTLILAVRSILESAGRSNRQGNHEEANMETNEAGTLNLKPVIANVCLFDGTVA